MNKLRAISGCIACVLAMAGPSPWAQKPAKPAWAQEPTSVLGLELGAAVDHYSLPACKDQPPDPPKYGFCVTFASNLNAGIGGIAVPAFDSGVIEMQGDIPTSVGLFAAHKNFERVKAVLIERYGRPTRASVSTLQNMAGATFQSQTLEWVGARVSLTLVERAGKVDQTAAVFRYLPAAQKDKAREASEVKSSAGKL